MFVAADYCKDLANNFFISEDLAINFFTSAKIKEEEKKASCLQPKASLISRIGQTALKCLQVAAYTLSAMAFGILFLPFAVLGAMAECTICVIENVRGTDQSNNSTLKIALNILTAPAAIPAMGLVGGVAIVAKIIHDTFLAAL
ncbi:MAG: hypothetical protein K0S07_313 [Chlamydiales bacterium]|nr:hypothetical protein [Chlamydiales bacterium]